MSDLYEAALAFWRATNPKRRTPTYEARAALGKALKANRPKKPKRASRADRWADACAKAREGLDDLRSLQEEYEGWRDNLPENLQSSSLGEKLETVCDLDIEGAVGTIDEAESVDLPLGFGND